MKTSPSWWRQTQKPKVHQKSGETDVRGSEGGATQRYATGELQRKARQGNAMQRNATQVGRGDGGWQRQDGFVAAAPAPAPGECVRPPGTRNQEPGTRLSERNL
ncbi:hypothetical protein KC19_10G003100 [Ceratodon purpureus]|uniref:Uncharacterized protein n=1 Tax=Ceratodon purpureus TaxID=3225 RepID=A0A8T0GGE0_CERPU|nr:hypothetical protein KC19_10G003100 [Ceratodon purpureus]